MICEVLDIYTKTRITPASQMPSFDTDKITALLNAAQSPTFKKLLDDHGKAKKALADAIAYLADVETKFNASIPPELKALLALQEPKTGKSKAAVNGDLKKPDLQELRQILDTRPGNVLNIRQDGFDSKAIKGLVKSYPDLLSYEKGTWPKVRYLR
jgi:hypothetical protein